MSENAQLEASYRTDIPVIFVSRGNAVKSRQAMAEELISGLLQNEKFLRTLQEKEP